MTNFQELIFKERKKRQKQTYLPENDNTLTLTERLKIATSRKDFNKEQAKKAHQQK